MRETTHLLFLIFVVLIILILILVTFIVLVVLTVILDVCSGLLLALHPPFRELLHHLEELLPVVLEQIVGDSEDVTCTCKDEMKRCDARGNARVTRLQR